jgi:hypothetical protein
VQAWIAEPAAVRVVAARLAREAYRIAPDDLDVRSLYLTTMLEQAVYETGPDADLSMEPGSAASRATDFALGDLERALAYALEGRQFGAATALVRLMARLGTPEELLAPGPQLPPLVRATQHPDRRLRLAAAEAIVTLNPQMPFAGSSFVVEVLTHLAATGGSRLAIVAGPALTGSNPIRGYLAALGYDTLFVATGRDLVHAAFDSPDVELALVAASLQRPTVDLMLQQLRHHPRTANLPVGVLAGPDELHRAEHLVRRDALAASFVEPYRQEDAGSIVERVRSLAGARFVPRDVRLGQAARALELLADLGRDRRFFDLLRAEEAVLAAQAVPGLTDKAIDVLANLGTPASQTTLADIAGRPALPIELRQAAAAAFCTSVEHHGILLTTDEIVAQYNRYNQSAALDRATQNVLAAVLDCIEAPTAALPIARRPEDH